VVLTSQKYFLPEVSATFHGRDIFAPVAGHLSLGLKPSTFGKRTDRWVGLDIGQPKTKRGQLMGEIIHTDRFGNLITNIGQEGFLRFIQSRSFTFKVGKKMIKGLRRGYWEGKRNEPIALFGSGGFLEIAVREGSAQKALKLKRGDQIIVSVKSHQ
jgi:S-adenosylmethionine hydrolase